MRIIKAIKRLFKKEISVDFDISSFLVFVYKLKNGKITLPIDITVPENFSFVLGWKGKCLDVVASGKNKLSLASLPKCVRRFKLDKVDKNGKLPNNFVANAYFVNQNLFEFIKFKSYRKMKIQDRKYGEIKFGLKGAYAFKIVDVELFMTNLLKVFDYLKNKEAEIILDNFINEFIVDYIEKQNYGYEVIKNSEVLTDIIYEKLIDRMSFCGVEIMGLALENVKFSKKVKNLIKTDEQYLEKLIDEKTELEQSGADKISNKILGEIESNKQIKIQDTDEIIIPINKIGKMTFAEDITDNSVDKVVQNEYNSKKVRCMLCGHENPSNIEKCELCNQRLSRRSINEIR